MSQMPVPGSDRASRTFSTRRASVSGAAAVLALILGAVLVAATARAVPLTSSQQAPPTVSGASACQVAPRSLDDLVALTRTAVGAAQAFSLGTPISTQTPPSAGVPADRSVIAEVVKTVEEQVACLNAGDLLHVTALWSDDYVKRTLGGLPAEVLGHVATPTPLIEDDRAILESISDVRLLNDGRVTAVVTTDDATSLVVFVESNGRYLIDDNFTLSGDGTPTP